MADLPPIQFKRSSTFGLEPNPSDLAVGELAINFPSSKIYTKDSDGNIVTLGFSSAGEDSDVSYFVDSEGTVISEEKREPNITIITDGTGTSWQNSAPLLDAKVGTRVTVVRQTGSGTFWEFERTANTHDGWDGVISQDGIVSLSYAGSVSYAICPFWYDNNYRLQRAYVQNADHATFSVLNNYWIWQFFTEPVNIGNGTALGTFQNGRGAENSTGEFFANTRVTFYDVDDNILADQEITHTAMTTNTINVTGNITGCKKIMMRGHNGNNFNPGFNDINFYVNGSTAYPTATSLTDQKWGAAFSNIAGGTNLSDSDEAIVLGHVSTIGGALVAGAYEMFRTNDWCTDGNTDPNNQIYMFWLNKAWTMGPGTFSNHRVPYPNDFWQETDVEYYDKNNNLVFDKNLSLPVASLTNVLPAYRDINRIIMRPGTKNNAHPTIQRWYPDLGRVKGEILNTYGVQEPELWIKASSSPFALFVNGATTTVPPWVQLTTD